MLARSSTCYRSVKRAAGQCQRRADVRHLTTNNHRLVLGIESSCDDSCAALLSAPEQYSLPRAFESNENLCATIHSSVVLKQDHGATNGIQPLHATHAHMANLPLAVAEALRKGKEQGILNDERNPSEIDAIAVTQGPGMASCLSQGLAMANMLSALWSKPLVHVHHMVAHALTPLLHTSDIRPPFLVYLLSGGHTQLVLCTSYESFQILATTTDDSIGDAFDKTARALRIPFDWSKQAPGAALEQFARPSQSYSSFLLPVPLRGKPEFSYSGLKSAIDRLVVKESSTLLKDENARRALAFAFQTAAFAQLQDKLRMLFSFSDDGSNGLLPPGLRSLDIKHVVVSGGVASNASLRHALQSTLTRANRQDVQLHFPPAWLCTDNAAMIAHVGLLHWRPTNNLAAKPRARWSVEEFNKDV